MTDSNENLLKVTDQVKAYNLYKIRLNGKPNPFVETPEYCTSFIIENGIMKIGVATKTEEEYYRGSGRTLKKPGGITLFYFPVTTAPNFIVERNPDYNIGYLPPETKSKTELEKAELVRQSEAHAVKTKLQALSEYHYQTNERK